MLSTDRQSPEGDPQVVPVLGVEAGVVDEVDAAAYDVPGGEGRPVRLPRPRRTERVPVVTVVAVRVLVPTLTTSPHHIYRIIRKRNYLLFQQDMPLSDLNLTDTVICTKEGLHDSVTNNLILK